MRELNLEAAPDMLKALMDFDYLSFVIESAVRNLEQPHTLDAVVFAIKAGRAAIAKADSQAREK